MWQCVREKNRNVLCDIGYFHFGCASKVHIYMFLCSAKYTCLKHVLLSHCKEIDSKLPYNSLELALKVSNLKANKNISIDVCVCIYIYNVSNICQRGNFLVDIEVLFIIVWLGTKLQLKMVTCGDLWLYPVPARKLAGQKKRKKQEANKK